MKKVQIQEIINLSSFIMVDPEYTTFIKYIKNEDFTSARLFLDKLLSKLHTELGETDHPDQVITQYRRCNRLEDLVLELILGVETKDESKNKPVRRRIIRE